MKNALVLVVVLLQFPPIRGEFSATFGPHDFLTVIEDETVYLEMNLTGVERTILLEAQSAATGVFRTNSNGSLPFHIQIEYRSSDENGDGYSVRIPATGVALGIAEMTFTVRDSNGRVLDGYQIPPYTVKVNRKSSVLDLIFRYLIAVWLILSYIAMGVKMDWRVIRRRLRRPWAVLIGALCQFIIMPLLSYALAKLLNLNDTASIGLITVGSCPGGWMSNVFSLLLDLDLVLSLTMTFCSTVLALGFMPLNLYIYSREFIDGNEALETPFFEIIMQLITLIVPVFIGMFILYKWPRVARILSLLVKPFVIGMVITTATIGVPANLYIFFSSNDVYMSSLVLPFIGGVLGLLCSKLACLCNKSALTVGIETAAQNSLLAANVIYLSYPNPEADLIRSLPFLVAFMTIFECKVIAVIVHIMRRCPGKPYEDLEPEGAIEASVDENEADNPLKDVSAKHEERAVTEEDFASNSTFYSKNI